MVLVSGFVNFDGCFWYAGGNAVPCGDGPIQGRFFEFGVIVRWYSKFS